jgi:hypothetical protein
MPGLSITRQLRVAHKEFRTADAGLDWIKNPISSLTKRHGMQRIMELGLCQTLADSERLENNLKEMAI